MNKKIIIGIIAIIVLFGLYISINFARNVSDLGQGLELLRGESKYDEARVFCDRATRFTVFDPYNIPCICGITELGLRRADNRELEKSENRSLTKNELDPIKKLCDELNLKIGAEDCWTKAKPICEEIDEQYKVVQ